MKNSFYENKERVGAEKKRNEKQSADRTKWLLSEAVKQTMEQVPLDFITVQDIVRHCGMTRQNFYRHFRSKYDLVYWQYQKNIQKAWGKMDGLLTWEEALRVQFRLMHKERCFYVAAFASKASRQLLCCEYECLLYFFRKFMHYGNPQMLGDEELRELEDYILRSATLTMQWARDGMLISAEQMAQVIAGALPQNLQDRMLAG